MRITPKGEKIEPALEIHLPSYSKNSRLYPKAVLSKLFLSFVLPENIICGIISLDTSVKFKEFVLRIFSKLSSTNSVCVCEHMCVLVCWQLYVLYCSND